ncbi:MAG: hypothetical protein QXF56_04270 [Candidatus Micrarchaeia archaeon]
MAEPPECGARAHLEFHCLECGRKVEQYETAFFNRKVCSDCYRRKEERRCARCFRKLESWQVKLLDGWEYCELCFLILERSASRGAWGEQFAFN